MKFVSVWMDGKRVDINLENVMTIQYESGLVHLYFSKDHKLCFREEDWKLAICSIEPKRKERNNEHNS